MKDTIRHYTKGKVALIEPLHRSSLLLGQGSVKKTVHMQEMKAYANKLKPHPTQGFRTLMSIH